MSNDQPARVTDDELAQRIASAESFCKFIGHGESVALSIYRELSALRASVAEKDERIESLEGEAMARSQDDGKLEREIERLQDRSALAEIERDALQAQLAQIHARAEDATEYVLASINRDLKEQLADAVETLQYVAPDDANTIACLHRLGVTGDGKHE